MVSALARDHVFAELTYSPWIRWLIPIEFPVEVVSNNVMGASMILDLSIAETVELGCTTSNTPVMLFWTRRPTATEFGTDQISPLLPTDAR